MILPSLGLLVLSTIITPLASATGVDLNALCPAADTGKSKCVPNQPNQFVICAGAGTVVQTMGAGTTCKDGVPVYPAGASPPLPTLTGNAVAGYPSTMGPYHSTKTDRKGSCKGHKDWTGSKDAYVCVNGTDKEVIRCDMRAYDREYPIWRLPDEYYCNKKKNQVLDRKTQHPLHEFDSYPGTVGYLPSGPNIMDPG